MWCDALNAPWEWVSSYCLFHPTITNQVGTAPNSQSLQPVWGIIEATHKTKQLSQSLALQNWSKIGDKVKSLRSELQLVMGVSTAGLVRLPACVRADTGAGAADPGRMCPPETLTAAQAPLFFRMLGRAVGANWKPGQGGVVSYKINFLDPL